MNKPNPNTPKLTNVKPVSIPSAEAGKYLGFRNEAVVRAALESSGVAIQKSIDFKWEAKITLNDQPWVIVGTHAGKGKPSVLVYSGHERPSGLGAYAMISPSGELVLDPIDWGLGAQTALYGLSEELADAVLASL